MWASCDVQGVVVAVAFGGCACGQTSHRRYTPAAAVKVLEEASPVMPCG